MDNQRIKNSFFGRYHFTDNFGQGKIQPTVLDKIASQTVVSSHVVDNIIRTIPHILATRLSQKIGIEKLKDTYFMYVQTFCVIFVQKFLHQKQKFLT